MSAESIFGKPVTKRQKAVLSRIAASQKKGDDSGVDYGRAICSIAEAGCDVLV